MDILPLILNNIIYPTDVHVSIQLFYLVGCVMFVISLVTSWTNATHKPEATTTFQKWVYATHILVFNLVVLGLILLVGVLGYIPLKTVVAPLLGGWVFPPTAFSGIIALVIVLWSIYRVITYPARRKGWM